MALPDLRIYDDCGFSFIFVLNTSVLSLLLFGVMTHEVSSNAQFMSDASFAASKAW